MRKIPNSPEPENTIEHTTFQNNYNLIFQKDKNKYTNEKENLSRLLDI